jgi:hypothetical protein
MAGHVRGPKKPTLDDYDRMDGDRNGYTHQTLFRSRERAAQNDGYTGWRIIRSQETQEAACERT